MHMSHVTATKEAIEKIRAFLQNIGAAAVRLDVKKQGCAGFSYALEYCNEKGADDVGIELAPDVVLFVDELVLPVLDGTVIEYEEKDFKSEFIFKNPNEKGKCCCGTSFYV